MIILSIDPAVKNCGLVSLCLDDNKINIMSTDLLNFCGDKKVKNVKFETIMKNMIDALNKKNFNNINLVLIENIPSRLNQTVKSISVAMYSYFMIKNIDVRFVSPSKKLSKEQNKLSYRERKKISVDKCLNILCEEDKKMILSHGKKSDDLTDCILNAIAFFENKKNALLKTS